MNRNIIALDIGDAKTGIAGLRANIPYSLDTIKTEILLPHIKEFSDQKKIDLIVVGLPVNDDGSENEQCQKVRKLASEIDKIVNCDIVLENEYLSSIEAQNNLRVLGLSPREIKQKEHGEVARILLDQYLKNAYRQNQKY